MSKLPKNFPEYSIMYKTLLKKINELDGKENKDAQSKIEKYQLEINRIKKMFPDGFFD